MGLEIRYVSGQTPLDEEEKEGLKVLSLSTKSELDEFEQKNIEQAVQWSIGKKFKPERLISEQFVRSLHQKMFGEVWKWAGQFRKTEKNIGVQSWRIPVELAQLLGDTIYWINHETYPPDEIAIRFKHRIVSIHCFPNGNGRHSRLMADLIAEKILAQQPFTWGQSRLNLSKEHATRTSYLIALKKADRGDFTDLLHFARS